MDPIPTPRFDPEDIRKNKTMAVLAFLGVLFFLPLVACPESAFGKWAANQGLWVLILSIAASVANIIPLLGTIVGLALSVAVLIFMIVGMVGAYNGEAKPLPVVGGILLIQ